MASFIIVEGPDGAGKTTLAETLVLHGYTYIKMGVPDCRPYDYWLRELMQAGDKTVVDRLYWSELVYGPIYRAGANITYDEIDRLNQVLWGCGALLIKCLPPKEEVLRNALARPDEIGYHKKISEVYDSYAGLFSMHMKLPSLSYDYTKDDLIRFARYLVSL